MVRFHFKLSRGALFIACAIFTYSQNHGSVNVSATIPLRRINTKSILGLFDSLSNFLNNSRSLPKTLHREKTRQDMYEVIKGKVRELKPLLQDDEIRAEEGEFTLEGEKTTILEIVPRKSSSRRALDNDNENQKALELLMAKYAQMRRSINTALAKEYVSDETKLIVTAIIDDLMAKIIEHQCTSNSQVRSISFKTRRSETKPIEMIKMWAQVWGRLRNQHSNIKKNGGDKEKFFEHFEKFLDDSIREMKSLTENFKVSCQLVELTNRSKSKTHKEIPYQTKNIARQSVDSNELQDKIDITVDGKATCANFKLCSEELIEFMAYFYKTLNDTVVSTLRNYGEMFKKDVNHEGKFERNDIVKLVQIIEIKSELCIDSIFRTQVRKFNLDSKSKSNSRMHALQEFVQKSVEEAKHHVRNLTVQNLKHLRHKLFETIRKDIYVNLDIDLGNLERELSVETICTVFKTCNGRYFVGRRFGNPPYLANRPGIYVKVQVSPDDKIHDGLSKKFRQLSWMGSNITIEGESSPKSVTRTSPMALVTRTTTNMKDEFIELQETTEFIDSYVPHQIRFDKENLFFRSEQLKPTNS